MKFIKTESGCINLDKIIKIDIDISPLADDEYWLNVIAVEGAETIYQGSKEKCEKIFAYIWNKLMNMSIEYIDIRDALGR